MTSAPHPLIPEGWIAIAPEDTFSAIAGPVWFRPYTDKTPGCGFLSERRHRNLGDVVHGGALLTLADMALFDIMFRAVGRVKAVTISLNADFIRPAPIGRFIEATGEAMKSEGSILMARGVISADGEALMTFSGSLKRLRE
jgi:uncharacterized protein (TIGR00369 family)